MVVHRSDLSGTTFNWTDYLSKVSDGWQRRSAPAPRYAGRSASAPAAAMVCRSTSVMSGAIGYVELTYALQRKLAYAAVRNRAGVFVQPTRDSFSAAVASAQWTPQQDFYRSSPTPPGTRPGPSPGWSTC